MAVSPVRETLTAPWGAINRVALDNNSCQALPPRSPALPSQAKQEDKRKGCEGDRKWCRGILRHAQSRARRPLTLGWTASREKIITQSYNFMTAAAAGCK